MALSLEPTNHYENNNPTFTFTLVSCRNLPVPFNVRFDEPSQTMEISRERNYFWTHHDRNHTAVSGNRTDCRDLGLVQP